MAKSLGLRSMTAAEWRRGTARVSRLQIWELKSTHQRCCSICCHHMILGSLGDRWHFLAFFLPVFSNQPGPHCFSGGETGWSSHHCTDKWTHIHRQKMHSSRNVLFMGKNNTKSLCFCQKKVPHPPFFPLLFPIAVKSFPETLFCNQSAHSGSYNYPTSSVQLTAPKQSSSEMGTCFYFDNACWGVQLIVRSSRWGKSGCAHPAARVSPTLWLPVIHPHHLAQVQLPLSPPEEVLPARLCCLPPQSNSGLASLCSQPGLRGAKSYRAWRVSNVQG